MSEPYHSDEHVTLTKHKHRPCPCGCGELADECGRAGPFSAFSIRDPEADAPHRAGSAVVTTSDTAAALASALPAGITYDIVEDNHYWLDAKEIAAFQAERLAESGYLLVRVDDEQRGEREDEHG